MDKYNNIPDELKAVPRWIPWKFVDRGTVKKAKVPKQLNGFNASPTNEAHWNDYLTTKQAVESNDFDGIGFVFNGSDFTGIDVDNCRNEDGSWSDLAQQILDKVDGYAEVSPSGNGLKIFTRADIPRSFKNDEHGVEVYNNSRYFTVTGDKIQGVIPQANQDLQFLFDQFAPQARKINADHGEKKPDPKYDIKRVVDELLSHIDPDLGYDTWLNVGMALFHQFEGSVEACEAWETWSSHGAKYISGECEAKWKTFGGRGTDSITLGTLKFYAKRERLEKLKRDGHIVIGEENNFDLYARTVLDHKFDSEDGYTIVFHNDDWYKYNGIQYNMIPEVIVDKNIREVLQDAIVDAPKGEKKLNPSMTTIANTKDALKAIVTIYKEDGDGSMQWITDEADRPDTKNLVRFQNGLLNVKSKVLMRNTRDLFSTSSLQFAYDPEAKCPDWENFLYSIWEDDQASIDTLQEIFGYLLTNDNNQQKFFMLLGQKRSGKGTINRILEKLVGKANMTSPSLESLADSFGKQGLIDKSVVSITDASLPESNQRRIIETFLAIVGNDPITINRKYKDPWFGTLPSRFILFTNEMLNFKTSNSAFLGRLIMLEMPKSFYGKENPDLDVILGKEVAGIFNWALRGNERRLARKHGVFVQPETGKQTLDELYTLSDSMVEFFEEYIEIDPDATEAVKPTFQLWTKYCQENNSHAGTKINFSKRLRLASNHQIKTGFPGVTDKFSNTRGKGYKGFKFTPRALEVLEEMNGFAGL